MLNFLKKEANKTITENGAMTYRSTMDACLDLFATAGGMRHSEEDEIVKRFVRAYTEDPVTALKLMFYIRDVRGGLGERRIFKVILKYLAVMESESVIRNIEMIPEFGRFDDLFILMDTPCEQAAITYIKMQLQKDQIAMELGQDEISLLAKWMPSINTSNQKQVRLAKRLAKELHMSERTYRKTLSALRKRIDIIENHMREVDYSFDYSKQTSKAMFKYRNAFQVHDGERYMDFLKRVSNKQTTMHTDTLMPYEILRPWVIHPYFTNRQQKVVTMQEIQAVETTWYTQKDFAKEQNALVVIDGSGSMYNGMNPSPAEVALSLGLYFAENNTGAFANHFITFSEHPQLVEVKGKNLYEKLQYVSSFNEVANTNVQAVFDLILDTAVNNKLSQSDMPETIFLISDMEFDYCAKGADMTNFEYAKQKFTQAGYQLPKVVFWNVASRQLQVPVKKNEQGVTLVSGCTPKLFEQVMSDATDPVGYMLEILNQERYQKIS